MLANTSSTTLYRIDEWPDVMADACVVDDQGNLIFLSSWARGTAVQQFLARLTLGRDEQGLDQFQREFRLIGIGLAALDGVPEGAEAIHPLALGAGDAAA